jgi:hypothetical protein
MRSTISSTLLGLLGAAAFPAAPAHAGPPNICHPTDIGDARSLPFGNGPFEPGSLAAADVPARTLEILDQSDDTLVHMETLRRAWVYLWEKGDQDTRRVQGLLDRLKDRVLEAEAADATEGRRALAWFDYGYLLGICAEGGFDAGRAGAPYLEKAARLAPQDARLRFGVAKGVFMEDQPAFYRHLHAAASGGAADALLAKNVRATVRHYDRDLDAEDFDDLVANLAKKCGADDEVSQRNF